MNLLALTWLYKELKKTRINKYNAELRQSNDDERHNLQTKIEILEYIIGVITAKGD